MTARSSLKREVRVALSLKAQPVWFRILKWIVVIALSVLLWGTAYFWVWIFGGLALGLLVHFVWRWKTDGWTRPWGGWNDLEAGRRD